MAYYVDLVLNLAGLLLWLNWRSIQFDPLAKRTPATLMGTLRPAAPKKLRPWHLLIFLILLLFLRAAIYWWIGSATNWTAKLDLGVVILPFRSDWFLHILVYSFFSFGLVLGIFYLCLLPLSLLAGPEPMHRLVKIPLGRVDDWPRWARIVLPFVVTAVLWWLASWLFCGLQIMPPPVAPAQRIEQAVLIGLDSYLIWRFPLGVLLLLHLLSSYIYFGRHSFWKYVNETAQKLLQPLHRLPLRLGRMDFAPLVGIIIIFLLANVIENGLTLHLGTLRLHLPGLVECYGKLPL
jgi:uncharacterized protein YggT (Ycf19 family)